MQINLLKHQHKTLTSKAKHVALISGVGAGKTWTGVHWCIKQAAEKPKALGFIGANTYGQLHNSTLRAVFNELDRLGITYTYNKSSGYLEFLNKQFLCKSLDNYDVLRGIEIGDYWIDEAAYAKKEAFDVLLGRLRDKKGCLRGLVTTTPKGFNWVYDYFHPAGQFNSSDYQLIRAQSGDNKFLPEGYIESLKEQYDEKLIEQELKGEFVSLTAGMAYYAFDVERIVRQVNQQPGTIFLGLDFNVDPLCGVLYQINGDTIEVFDELFLRNSDTFRLCKEMLNRGYQGARITADSTGANRKTSGQSDFDILRQAGFVIEPTYNPYVIDRINNMNRLMVMNRMVIDPKCKHLINDLGKVQWKDNKLDQKSDYLLTHISDALGYGAWFHFPIGYNKTRNGILFE